MGYRALLLAAAVLLCATHSNAAVSLNAWTAESYEPTSPGVWNVASDGLSVLQTGNGHPTLFYSDINAHYTDVRATLRVIDEGVVTPEGVFLDDDFIGFALGFRPNDSLNSLADYLLIDWKQGTQSFDFGGSSTTPGTTALKGLAVSRVTGVPTADEFWGHTNFVEHTSGGLTELARGSSLGDTGWERFIDYDFRLVFTPTTLQVFVNNNLEIDLLGSFSDGRIAFYNFSQPNVNHTIEQVSLVPEPSTFVLLGLGSVALMGYERRRRRLVRESMLCGRGGCSPMEC